MALWLIPDLGARVTLKLSGARGNLGSSLVYTLLPGKEGSQTITIGRRGVKENTISLEDKAISQRHVTFRLKKWPDQGKNVVDKELYSLCLLDESLNGVLMKRPADKEFKRVSKHQRGEGKRWHCVPNGSSVGIPAEAQDNERLYMKVFWVPLKQPHDERDVSQTLDLSRTRLPSTGAPKRKRREADKPKAGRRSRTQSVRRTDRTESIPSAEYEAPDPRHEAAAGQRRRDDSPPKKRRRRKDTGEAARPQGSREPSPRSRGGRSRVSGATTISRTHSEKAKLEAKELQKQLKEHMELQLKHSEQQLAMQQQQIQLLQQQTQLQQQQQHPQLSHEHRAQPETPPQARKDSQEKKERLGRVTSVGADMSYAYVDVGLDVAVVAHAGNVDISKLQVGDMVAFKVETVEGGEFRATSPVWKQLAGATSQSATLPEYVGTLKSVNAQGSGFLECPIAQVEFGRDTFVHHTVVADYGLVAGDALRFDVSVDTQGRPYAGPNMWKCVSYAPRPEEAPSRQKWLHPEKERAQAEPAAAQNGRDGGGDGGRGWWQTESGWEKKDWKSGWKQEGWKAGYPEDWSRGTADQEPAWREQDDQARNDGKTMPIWANDARPAVIAPRRQAADPRSPQPIAAAPIWPTGGASSSSSAPARPGAEVEGRRVGEWGPPRKNIVGAGELFRTEARVPLESHSKSACLGVHPTRPWTPPAKRAWRDVAQDEEVRFPGSTACRRLETPEPPLSWFENEAIARSKFANHSKSKAAQPSHGKEPAKVGANTFLVQVTPPAQAFVGAAPAAAAPPQVVSPPPAWASESAGASGEPPAPPASAREQVSLPQPWKPRTQAPPSSSGTPASVPRQCEPGSTPLPQGPPVVLPPGAPAPAPGTTAPPSALLRPHAPPAVVATPGPPVAAPPVAAHTSAPLRSPAPPAGAPPARLLQSAPPLSQPLVFAPPPGPPPAAPLAPPSASLRSTAPRAVAPPQELGVVVPPTMTPSSGEPPPAFAPSPGSPTSTATAAMPRPPPGPPPAAATAPRRPDILPPPDMTPEARRFNIEYREKLREAKEATARGDFKAAAKAYRAGMKVASAFDRSDKAIARKIYKVMEKGYKDANMALGSKPVD